MGMSSMGEVNGMEGMMDMASITSVAASSPPDTVLAAMASTPTLVVSSTAETGNSSKADAPSTTQMDSMASMSGMSNAFHFGSGDTLWITSLTPTNSQGYAGAISLLILMALFLRFLTTLRSMVEKRWAPKQPSRCNGDEANNYLKMGQTREDEVEVRSGHRWNTTTQLSRALFQLTTMTIGYLLLVSFPQRCL